MFEEEKNNLESCPFCGGDARYIVIIKVEK